MKSLLALTLVISALSFAAEEIRPGTTLNEVNVVSAFLQPVAIPALFGESTETGHTLYVVAEFANPCSVALPDELVQIFSFSDDGNGTTTARVALGLNSKRACTREYNPQRVTINLGVYSTLSSASVNGVQAIAPMYR